MNECLQFDLPDPQATDKLGARLVPAALRVARNAPDGLLITLDGPLGAGKSSLARAFLRAAGIEGPIPSPTFALVEPYEGANVHFYHLDLYRLGDVEELSMLGYDEMRVAGSIVLMEWAGRFTGLRRAAGLAIELEYAGDGRRARLCLADPGAWPEVLD